MRYMYYCASCDYLGSDEGEYSGAICPECGRVLFATYYPRDDWKRKNNEEKSNLKESWKKKILQNEEKADYALADAEESYEYDVITILNENHGRIDKNKMRTVLSQKAREGWRLHTVYSNELGKNALMVLGLGHNATACEDVLVFERKIKKKD